MDATTTSPAGARAGISPFGQVLSKTQTRKKFADLLTVLETTNPVVSTEMAAITASLAKNTNGIAACCRGLRVIELGLEPLGYVPKKSVDRSSVDQVKAERDRLLGHLLADFVATWASARKGKKSTRLDHSHLLLAVLTNHFVYFVVVLAGAAGFDS